MNEHLLALGSLVFMTLPVWPAIREFKKPQDDTPLFITKGNTADFLTTKLRDHIPALKAEQIYTIEDENQNKTIVNLLTKKVSVSDILAQAKNAGHIKSDSGESILNIYAPNLIVVDKMFAGNIESSTLVLKSKGELSLKLRANKIYTGAAGVDAIVEPDLKLSSSDLEDVYLYDHFDIKREIQDVSHNRELFSTSHLVLNTDFKFEHESPVYHKGSIKSKKFIRIPAGSIIKGNIVSDGDIDIGEHCYIQGAILAKGDVRIGASCKIGSDSHKTTISGNKVRLMPKSVISGTILSLSGIEQ